jgi:hypothetical protein
MEEDQPQEFDLEVRARHRAARGAGSGPRSGGSFSPAQGYIGSYSSHTKIDRLLFIAERSYNKPLELEALRLAADELRQVR